MPEDHAGHLPPAVAPKKKILYWVDSMHPWYKSDKPGKAPDCGMDLTPVYEDGEASPESQPSAAVGRAPVKVSEGRRQLIGVRSEAVQRRPLIREIDAMGRVAYDPDLYLAQNEFLITRRTSGGGLEGLQGGLVRAARSRLQLLGMSEAQIRELERSGKAQAGLVLPQKGSGVWIYGSIFETDLPWVKAGDAVQVTVPGSATTYESAISSLDPTINPQTRTAQLRLRLSNEGQELRPDMFVKIRIKADGGEVLTVPNTAILHTGKRDLVYLDQGQGQFVPREIKVGRRGTEDSEVLGGLAEGDKVVTNGNFLLDSESSLKATFSGHEH